MGRQHTVAASWRTETSWCRAPPAPSGRTGPVGAGHHIAPSGRRSRARPRPAPGRGRNRARAPRGRTASRNAASRRVGFEIDRIHRAAPAAPVIGAAAQRAQPARVQRRIAHAGLGAGIHFLDLGIETGAARFQQGDGNPAVRERQGQGNAGRPAADDGEVRRQHLCRWESCGRQSGRSKRRGPGKRVNLSRRLEDSLPLIVSRKKRADFGRWPGGRSDVGRKPMSDEPTPPAVKSQVLRYRRHVRH